MSRTLSSAALAALFGAHTEQVFLFLLKISHTDMSTIYIANNTESVSYDGDTYEPFPFTVTMPPEKADQVGKAKLTVCMVDRQVIAEIRALSTAPDVVLNVILASGSSLEAGPFAFKLRNISYNALTLEGDLSYEGILDEPIPQFTFNPNDFPGVFGS